MCIFSNPEATANHSQCSREANMKPPTQASLMAAGQVEAVIFWINHIILIQIALHFMNYKKLWLSNFEIYNLIIRFSTRQTLTRGWFAMLCLFFGGGDFRCWGQYLHFHQYYCLHTQTTHLIIFKIFSQLLSLFIFKRALWMFSISIQL